MDENMKEIFNAYSSIVFDTSRIWIDKDKEYDGLSLLQKYNKFVKKNIVPEWDYIVEYVLDDKTIQELYDSPPKYFHKFPNFSDDTNFTNPESYSDDEDDENICEIKNEESSETPETSED